MDEYFKKLTNIIFRSTLFLFLTSCTTLNLSNPIPEIESPTIQGNNQRVGFEFSVVSGKELLVAEDPSKRPLVIDKNNLKTATAVFTKTGIAWYPTNSLTLTGGVLNSSILYVKGVVRILGSYREEPEPGLFYLSVNLESTYQMAKSSGDTNGVAGPTGYPWEGSSQNISGTGGLTVGYQFFKRAAPFLGFNYQQFQTSGKIKHLVSSNGLDAGGEYELGVVTGTTEVIGLGIEFRPKSRFFITPVLQYYNLNWGGNKIQDMTGSIRLTYVPI